MNSRVESLLFVALALGTGHCASTVGPGGTAAVPDGSAADHVEPHPSPDASAEVAPPTQRCAAVRASCGPAPQQFVRGHAEGLEGLEGARVQFAVRYQNNTGQGLDVPHGVAVAAAQVARGAFEACVCIPYGGSWYPQVAAVVFAPGTSGETSRDVTRAMFSSRYATLGDENVSYALTAVPSVPQVEAALAAMVTRTERIRVGGLDATMEGAQAYAGLVANERPIAAQVSGGRISGGALQAQWFMPGRAWLSERLALVVDRNGNRRCDDGDVGALVGLDGRHDLVGIGGPWTQGTALQAICRAVSLEAERER